MAQENLAAGEEGPTDIAAQETTAASVSLSVVLLLQIVEVHLYVLQ